MNREMYNEVCQAVPDFAEKWVMEVDTSKIVLDSQNSQIRKNGAVIQKVAGMLADIEANGQQVPADVKRLANGNYELKDGITRYLAQKERNQPLKVTTWYDQKFTTPDEWALHQAKCNDHEVSTPNTKEDIKYQVKKFLSDGVLERSLGFKQHQDPERFLKEAPVFLKDKIYKRSGVPLSSIRSWLKGYINKSSMLGSRYENYTKSQAWSFFSAHNKLGWSGTKAGEICNNICVYALPNDGDAKDLYGNVWRKTEKNPNVDIYVLIWVNSLADKDDNSLQKAREKLVELYSKGQNHPRFKAPMFKGAFILPQIKSGPNKENINKLYLPKEINLTKTP